MDRRPVISDTYDRQPFKLVGCFADGVRVVAWTRAPCMVAMVAEMARLKDELGALSISYAYVRDRKTGDK